MSVAYWTTLALAIASSGVSIAYAFDTLDRGHSAREHKSAVAAKSDRLPGVAQSAARYITVESPSLGGSTLRRVAIEGNADEVSRSGR
jgi:hypothetical protein